MRKEASLGQWRGLYEAATRIKELKPWEKFWDMDLIGIKYGEEEDAVFFSILGRGECYGIAVHKEILDMIGIGERAGSGLSMQG